MIDTLTLTAMGATAVACWQSIRSVFDRVRALLIVRTSFTGDVASAISAYLYASGRVISWGDTIIRSGSSYVRPLERVAEVAWESTPVQPRLVHIDGSWLVFCSPSGGPGPGSMANLPSMNQHVVITALRGTLDVVALTRRALDYTSELQTSGRRYFVRRIGGKNRGAESLDRPTHARNSPCEEIKPHERFLHWSRDDIGAPRPEDPFAAMQLCASGEAARREFHRWRELKDWYQRRGIPWRRGFLLYGPPGTGKTSLARALAQEADMPVFAYDLATLCNDEFNHHWQQMQESAPCMALIEDIDGVFTGRTNVIAERKHGDGLTFDCLLNAMSGIQSADGVFIVVTTNKPETLDEALGRPMDNDGSTRPGRLDRAFCLALPDATQRAAILQRIIGHVDEAMLSATANMSAAQVTEHAVAQVLALTWGEKELRQLSTTPY